MKGLQFSILLDKLNIFLWLRTVEEKLSGRVTLGMMKKKPLISQIFLIVYVIRYYYCPFPVSPLVRIAENDSRETTMQRVESVKI